MTQLTGTGNVDLDPKLDHVCVHCNSNNVVCNQMRLAAYGANINVHSATITALISIACDSR